MEWVSFDPFRTQGFPNTTQLKPERFFESLAVVRRADWILFPEYWQVSALVFGMGAHIFPSHASYVLGHNKVEMTRALKVTHPFNIPETHIRANTPVSADELWEAMTTPFVAKLPRSAEGRGVWLIEQRADWRRYLDMTDTLYVQEYLPIDRDIRVAVVGGEVVASYWRLQSPDGFHNNVARGGRIVYDDVPVAAVNLALDVAAVLGIDHAGFDIAMVGGRPYILEFNRLFGNAGIPGGNEALKGRILGYLLRNSPNNTPRLPRAA